MRVRTVSVALSIVLMLAVSAAILADYHEPPFDPFSSYADIMIGQPTNGLAEKGFTCKHIDIFGGSGHRYYCSIFPTSGVFHQIDVSPYAGQVRTIHFKVRANTLKVGHLVIRWGEPQVSIYDQLLNLYWERESIQALAPIQSDHFSYFLPIQSITFN